MPLDPRSLALGHAGERLVVSFLNARGSGVIPSYDFTGSDGQKAPRLMFSAHGLVIPDLDVSKDGIRSWLEVKTYHGPARNEREDCLVHGIERRLFDQYLGVEQATGTPVWIGVLEYLSGEFLIARLRSLKNVWPCMCPPCRNAAPRHCYSRGVQNGMYWPKRDMQLLHVFSDDDLVEIRTLATKTKATAAA